MECFGQDTGSDGDQVDYLKLPLDQESTGDDKNASSGSTAPAFMIMDLQALWEDSGGNDAKTTGTAEKVMGNFLEEILTFVRDHLVSRPLLTVVAAAAERSADGKGDDEGIQEGFLLLCEVRSCCCEALAWSAAGEFSGRKQHWNRLLCAWLWVFCVLFCLMLSLSCVPSHKRYGGLLYGALALKLVLFECSKKHI